jgi:hypothetical protein
MINPVERGFWLPYQQAGSVSLSLGNVSSPGNGSLTIQGPQKTAADAAVGQQGCKT